VTGGTLALSADGVVPGSSAVQAAAGASLDLSGKAGGYAVHATQTTQGGGSIVGSLGIGGGATVAPGSSPGTLKVTGDFSFDADGNYHWQVLAAAPGGARQVGGWDLLSAAVIVLTASLAALPLIRRSRFGTRCR